MNRSALTAVLSLLLASHVAPVLAQEMELGTDVSPYRQFVIYPHVQRGLAAWARGDAAAAVQAFERARSHAPKNTTTALYLADAYERSGQSERARQLLKEQKHFTPDDQRLEVALARHTSAPIAPAPVAPATADTTVPRKVLPQPNDLSAVRQDAQNAIYRGDGTLARQKFATLDAAGALMTSELQQWFNVLLASGDLEAARILQSRPGLQKPLDFVALAEALAAQGRNAELAAYLGKAPPNMRLAGLERRWIVLLGVAARRDPRPLLAYAVKNSGNRQAHARAALPFALAGGDMRVVGGLIHALPSDEALQARFTHALASGDRAEAARTGQILGDPGRGSPAQVDSVSFALVKAGATDAAFQVLVAALPFSGQPAPALLYARLAELLEDEPARLTTELAARLRQPSGDPQLQSGQILALAAAQDCAGVEQLMSDVSGTFSAQAWAARARCQDASGSAIAAASLMRALEIEPGNRDYRLAYAYAAYASGDFANALQAWQQVSPSGLTAEQLLAAGETALAAEDEQAAKLFLDERKTRADPLDARYWSLRSRSQQHSDPAAAQESVLHAIQLQPLAGFYRQLATLQQAEGQQLAALESFEQASTLSPDDMALRVDLAYAQLAAGRSRAAAEQLSRLHDAYPKDPRWAEELAYALRNSGELELAREATADAIDLLADDAGERERHFRLRRMHEQLGRTWAFNADITLGDTGAASVGANPGASGVAYRSYAQIEAQYRFGSIIGREDHEALAAYARTFAGSGPAGDLLPRSDATLGVGLRWKPLRDRIFYLAVEQQVPLQSGGRSEWLLRASASPLRDPRYSDDWHADGEGWLAHSVYLDTGLYARRGNSFFTADYQVGLHRKFAVSSTWQPYVRLQYNGQGVSTGYRHDLRAGAGLRLNHWYGERGRDAFRRRFTLALEWQQPITSYLEDSGSLFLTAGHRW